MDLPRRESEAPDPYFVTSCFRGAPWAIASSCYLNEGGECRGCERSPESTWSKMELLRRGRGEWIAKLGKIKIPKRRRKWNFQLAELSSLSE
jgi:hypothetical protein